MGLVDEVFPHPTDTNTLLMSTNSSGIWKTTDRGINWKCVTENKELIPGMGVLSIEANPDNPNELFAAAGNVVYGFDSYGGAVLKSTDWGDNWEIVRSFDSVFKGKSVGKIVYRTSGNLYAVANREIFYSEDNAKNWKSIFRMEEDEEYIKSRAQYIADFEITPNGTLFVSSAHLWGAKGNVWISKNNGNTWNNLEDREEFNSLKNKHIFSVKLAVSELGELVLSFNDSKKLYLYKTIDEGKTFSKKGEVGLTWETGDAKVTKFEMEFSIDNPKKLYLGFIEFFEWDSVNGLKMLSPAPNISAHEHDDVRAMRVIKAGGKERVIMGNDGGISYYYPETKKFESLNGYSLPILQIYNLAISQFDSNFTMLIGTQDNGTYKYENQDWNFISGGDGGGNVLNDNANLQVNFMNSLIIVYQGKMKKYYSPNNRYSSWFIDSPIEVSPSDSTLLYGSGKKGNQQGARIYFQDIKRGQLNGTVVPGITKIGEIAVSNSNPNKVWLAEGEHIDKNDGTPKFMKTIDKGKSFVDLTGALVYPDPNIDIPNRGKDTLPLREMLSYRTITDIEVDPYDDDILYASLSGFFKPESWTKSWEYYRVLKSEDGGESWYDYSYGLPVTPIHCLLRDERDESGLICGGDEGVYWKRNENYNWEIFDGNFPKNTTVSDLKLNYCQNRLYVSTYGRGVWSLGFPEKHKGINFGGHGTEISEIRFNNDSINSYRFIKKDFIIVKKGKTLTITSDIVLSPNATIILAPKSKLIIDGGSISSACNENWKGEIDIIEQRFLWIFKRKKGKVILKNGGKINK